MTTFADDFNRADSSNLGAGWVEVSGDWSIISSQLSPGNAGGTILLRATTDAATDDNFAQATIAATAAASQGFVCRGNANFTNGYLWRNNGTSWDLFSIVGGSFTSLATYAAAAAPGDVARVQAVGSTIKAFVNGVERASVINTDVATGKSSGIRAESTNALRFDDFSSGDISSGSDVPGTVDGAFGGLGGSVAGTREVTASVAQAFGGLSGAVTGTREVSGTVSGVFGGFTGTVVVPGDAAGTEAATTTQVVQAWLRQAAGFPNSSTVVPEPDSWMTDPGFWVRIAGVVGGGMGLYVPDNGPVVQIEVIAAARAATGAKSTSRKIPRGRAESKMQAICNKTFEFVAGLELMLPENMRPVWIETIYPVSAVRELPDPRPNFARYSADIYVGWIERNPVG